MVDLFTKYVEAVALTEKQLTSQIAGQALVDHVITRYTYPKRVITDNGRQFVSQLFDRMCQFYGIEHVVTTAYHPQSNGAAERVNRAIMDIIAKYVNEGHTDWDHWLPVALGAYRFSYHETIGTTPCQALMSFAPRFGLQGVLLRQDVDEMDWVSDKVKENFREMQGVTRYLREGYSQKQQLQQARQKAQHDRHIRGEMHLKPGQLVMRNVWARDHWRANLTKKFCDRFDGPWIVLRIDANDKTAAIRDLGDGEIRRENMNVLKVYTERFNSLLDRPVPTEEELEKILQELDGDESPEIPTQEVKRMMAAEAQRGEVQPPAPAAPVPSSVATFKPQDVGRKSKPEQVAVEKAKDVDDDEEEVFNPLSPRLIMAVCSDLIPEAAREAKLPPTVEDETPVWPLKTATKEVVSEDVAPKQETLRIDPAKRARSESKSPGQGQGPTTQPARKMRRNDVSEEPEPQVCLVIPDDPNDSATSSKKVDRGAEVPTDKELRRQLVANKPRWSRSGPRPDLQQGNFVSDEYRQRRTSFRQSARQSARKCVQCEVEGYTAKVGTKCGHEGNAFIRLGKKPPQPLAFFPEGEMITKALAAKEMIGQLYRKFIPFFTRRNPFSNHYPCRLVIGGVDWETPEKYYYVNLAHRRQKNELAVDLFAHRDPGDIKRMCRERLRDEQGVDYGNQLALAYDLLFTANFYKYMQNDDLRDMLYSTIGCRLVEANPHDKTWGAGFGTGRWELRDPEEWIGHNLFGDMLNILRESLIYTLRYQAEAKSWGHHVPIMPTPMTGIFASRLQTLFDPPALTPLAITRMRDPASSVTVIIPTYHLEVVAYGSTDGTRIFIYNPTTHHLRCATIHETRLYRAIHYQRFFGSVGTTEDELQYATERVSSRLGPTGATTEAKCAGAIAPAMLMIVQDEDPSIQAQAQTTPSGTTMPTDTHPKIPGHTTDDPEIEVIDLTDDDDIGPSVSVLATRTTIDKFAPIFQSDIAGAPTMEIRQGYTKSWLNDKTLPPDTLSPPSSPKK